MNVFQLRQREKKGFQREILGDPLQSLRHRGTREEGTHQNKILLHRSVGGVSPFLYPSMHWPNPEIPPCFMTLHSMTPAIYISLRLGPSSHLVFDIVLMYLWYLCVTVHTHPPVPTCFYDPPANVCSPVVCWDRIVQANSSWLW